MNVFERPLTIKCSRNNVRSGNFYLSMLYSRLLAKWRIIFGANDLEEA